MKPDIMILLYSLKALLDNDDFEEAKQLVNQIIAANEKGS